jgi:2,3-dihydro-2,3-dihydroxybenzoate dehydrogenase
MPKLRREHTRGIQLPKYTTVVIGAAQGIGAAIARELAAAPDTGRLVLADIQPGLVEELAAELAKDGGEVAAAQVDITDEASLDQLLRVTTDATRVALVAGIFQAKSSLEVTRDEMRTILDVNLMGTFAAAQGYAAAMVAAGGGSICAVGSIAARMPRMRQAAYCASKAGMRQALRVLGMEVVAQGVRINFVAPGPTATPMMSTLSSDHGQQELWRGSPEALRPPIPDRRVGLPEDVASAVAFLLSDQASHIALHDLYVDGGESLGL